MNSKTFSIALLTTCLAAPSLNAEDTASSTSDPAGTWHWTQDYGQGAIENWLVLKTSGNELTGQYIRVGSEIPIKKGVIKDGKLTFELSLQNERNGKPIAVTCEGSVHGDKLTGKSNVQHNDRSTEFELKAKRATRPIDVVGNWKLHIEAEGQQFTPEVHIRMKDEKLTAKYVTEEVGTHNIEDLTLKDNKLEFSLSLVGDSGSLDLEYQGLPRGDAITGDVQYEAGSTSGKAEFTGRLTKPNGDD